MQRLAAIAALRPTLAARAAVRLSGPSSRAPPLAVLLLWSQVRWSGHSSSSNNNAAAATPATSSTSVVAPPAVEPPTPTTTTTATAGRQYSPEVLAQIVDWEAKLAGVSPADRQLIIGSLLHPEEQKASKMGGPGIGPKTADMVAAFTCGKCDYRMVKKFSKHAYTKGIVIIECPNCNIKHLLADNLGWMEDTAINIEEILRERGESFIRVGEGDYVALGEEAAADGAQVGAEAEAGKPAP